MGISRRSSAQVRVRPFFQRALRLDGNPLVKPLPVRGRDRVGQEVSDIPRVLSRIRDDFESTSHVEVSDSTNRITAWNFVTLMKALAVRTAQMGSSPQISALVHR